MSELKRTQLYDIHVAAGAELVDFVSSFFIACE